MIRAISCLASLGATVLLMGTAQAQAPTSRGAQASPATQAPGRSSATVESEAVDPEVVWLRKRVEQLESLLASAGSSCSERMMQGMMQGQTMRQGQHAAPEQQHPGRPMPGMTPPTGASPQQMPPGGMPEGGHM